MKNSYDFGKFSKTDIQQYKTILEQQPYNPNIQDYFEWRKRVLRKLRRADERHLSYDSFMEEMQKQEVETFEEQIVNAIVLNDAWTTLTQTQRQRLEAYEAGFTMQEIADMEGVSKVAVFYSISYARNKLKKILADT